MIDLGLIEKILIFQLLCQFLTERGKIAITILDGYFHQIQVAIEFRVILHGKELIAVAWGNLIQELGKVADVPLLVGLETGGDEDNAFVGQSVASFGIVPEAHIQADALFADEHVEAHLVTLKCNVIHTDAIVLIEIHGNVKH